MNETKLHEEMTRQLKERTLLDQARQYTDEYFERVSDMRAVPSDEDKLALRLLDEALPAESQDAEETLALLQRAGNSTISAQGGGRYFGFVNGGILPVSLAARWLGDAWDQNAALYVMSPLTATLEHICERWLVELLGLPEGTAAGFVSGSSTATLCGLAAARDSLLLRQDWDVRERGLYGAPIIRVVLGEQAHSSVHKALSLLGMGKSNVIIAPVDDQGRVDPAQLPALDSNTLLILQAGNVNGGAFDPFEPLCARAREAGAWVHVDGAFGLWAAACAETKALARSMALADSWSTDAHKTLNAPYDNGVVFCRDRSALVQTMQASGSYLIYSEQRDSMLYTPEMSRRARSIELWAALRYLGKSGVDALVSGLCANARYFGKLLAASGFRVLNDVVFNQLVVACDTQEETKATLQEIQQGGVCWCGGAVWRNEPVIRVSVCSWRTTREDVEKSVQAFVDARARAQKLY
ncbi:MAG TPA: aminotransferase class V-fold PLP-dependent enzyme [Clostridia bacterium]|nr:aminotransferase class V-fold PLP-dependent enzyme [Clostridia bacterium]